MSQTVSDEAYQPVIKKDWRYYLGLTCLGLALVMPLFGLVVLPLDLPAGIKAAVMGAMALGGPEMALVVAAALLGKETLKVFTGRILSAIGRLVSSRPASRFRYYACLTVMVANFLGWYVYDFFFDVLPTELIDGSLLVSGDIAFIVAFIAAGPEFWEKIQRLFRWEGHLQKAA